MTPTVVHVAGLFALAAPPAASGATVPAPLFGWPDAVIALGGAMPAQGVSPLIQLLPFALVLGIFYFVILLPMKRRQKKVQAFLDGLKVGDRVVTTGGIFGSVTKISDQSIQIQIAANVRVDISRAAIVGYQGQPPVADQNA